MIHYDNITPLSLEFPKMAVKKKKETECFEFSMPARPYKESKITRVNLVSASPLSDLLLSM